MSSDEAPTITLKSPRFYHPMVIAIQQLQVARFDSEGKLFRFSRIQMDTVEADEVLLVGRNTAEDIAYI